MKIMDLGDLSDFPVETLKQIADADLDRIQHHEQRLAELIKRRNKVCEEIQEREGAIERIKGHVDQFLGEDEATEDLRIFEIKRSYDASDLNAEEIAEETIEDGRLIDSDELAEVLALKVGENVQLGTFIVVTRKSDRDRGSVAGAEPITFTFTRKSDGKQWKGVPGANQASAWYRFEKDVIDCADHGRREEFDIEPDREGMAEAATDPRREAF